MSALCQTHCAKGHEFIPENTYTYTYTNGRTKRWCKKCRHVNSTNSYARHPIGTWPEERVTTHHLQTRKAKLARYGLSPEDYDFMMEQQGGLCAICQKPEVTKKKSLSIDHDHATEATRQLLCHHCNSLLGHAFDNEEILWRAVRYLKFWKEV